MNGSLIAITLLLALATPLSSFSAGLPPWQLGMSKADVSALTDFGPYRSFSNGDMETFNGIWDGKKQNVQFFFDAKGLQRIGVSLYEGESLEAARMVWRQAYDCLEAKYGKIKVPEVTIEAGSDTPNSEVLSIGAAANVQLFGKIQMAPVHQPNDMFVFSSFTRRKVQGNTFFYVVIYLNRLR